MDRFTEAGIGLEPLEGGWSGETFVADAGGDKSVVRIFADPRHAPAAAEIIASLHRLVRGLVPVPEVLEVRRPHPSSGAPALLVTSFVEGVRGDLLLPTLGDDALRRLGAAFGEVAAVLAGMPTLRSGTWAGSDLGIDPFRLELPEWVERHREALHRQDWSAAELADLMRLADRAQTVLERMDRTCVVHSDLNPKNLLVAPDTLRVAAVLDWEFSHSGHPATDVGNLVRFDRSAPYVDGVLGAWTDRHGGTRKQLLDLARAADLVALVELAARSGQNPVATRAEAHLRAIVGSGDLHAVP